MSQPQKNVVIVDDDAEVGRAVARLLKAAGFHASTFCSGESLLATDRSADADCFIFDIHMPGMSGLDLADRLRETGVGIPIIFITAHDDPVSRERARKAGATGFVLKPFDSAALLGLLSRAVA